MGGLYVVLYVCEAFSRYVIAVRNEQGCARGMTWQSLRRSPLDCAIGWQWLV